MVVAMDCCYCYCYCYYYCYCYCYCYCCCFHYDYYHDNDDDDDCSYSYLLAAGAPNFDEMLAMTATPIADASPAVAIRPVKLSMSGSGCGRK